MSKKFNIGIIGCGYWGPNLIRVFNQHKDCSIMKCCDLNKDRTDLIKKQYPFVGTTSSYNEAVKDPRIEIVVIATPVSTHFPIAKLALAHGKHILLEKPMAASVDEAKRLVDIAKINNRTIMVDHTFIYMGSVRKMKDIIVKGELGKILYYDSVRINLGLFQHDVNVIWDLAPHDIAIMDFLIGKKPREISAIGVGHIHDDIENIAYISVKFDDNLLAHFHVNWLAPVKIRRTFIGGTKKMMVFDDLEGSEKVKIYDKGVVVRKNPKDIYKLLIGYRSGDVYSPSFDPTEALQVECEHFIDCLKNNKTPISDGMAGLRVVEILEAANNSLKNNGKPQRLK